MAEHLEVEAEFAGEPPAANCVLAGAAEEHQLLGRQALTCLQRCCLRRPVFDLDVVDDFFFTKRSIVDRRWQR